MIYLKVWGKRACFTRPEMKVERASYDVMTPSAARGILEAIYWHPGFVWRIDSIRVCKPIKFANIRRNEVKNKASYLKSSIAASDSKEIQQRFTMFLQDVCYVIKAHFDLTDKATALDNTGKFQEIIKRRIKKGQCYHQPYFGCREFPANFQGCDQVPSPCPEELKGEKDLGWMLYDLDYSDSQNIQPRFFRAKMIDGEIIVPAWDSKEVKG